MGKVPIKRDCAYNKSVEHMPQKITSGISWCAVAAICFFALILMLVASFGESAITDERAHIPAGYGYVANLDYRLNPEHPPLVKVLAGIPLRFLNVNFPTQSTAWTSEINGQWTMGTQFLYESQNDADKIIRWARIGPMLLTLALSILIYLWSRELLGRLWGLLPVFLFALSPNILAHGHYVTTDVAAAFGIVLATYYFLKFLSMPSRRRLFAAGIAFGVAQLTKFSTVLLVPYFAFLLIVYYAARTADDLSRFGTRAWRYLRGLTLIFLIGYALIVYPVYAVLTVNYQAAKQTADTEFILTSFANGPTPQGEICKPMRCIAELNIAMTKNPVTRPFAEYLLGILMVLQRSAGGNTNYFLGEVSAAGWSHYFPVVYVLKEPQALLLFVLVALSLAFNRMIRRTIAKARAVQERILDYLQVNFAEFSMAVFVAIYWTYSIAGNLNIGFRHLIPTLPFIYILSAGVWKRWENKKKYILLGALVLWFFISTVAATPHFLSYFNPLGGGIRYGYRYVTDSNYDWGQDLIRLKKFVDSRPEVDRIAVDYFGGGDPKYYLGTGRVEYWWSARGNPSKGSPRSDSGQAGQVPPIHWLAVSVNTLQGAIQPLAPNHERKSQDKYRWLTELRPPAPGLGNVPEPDFRAGKSIFIYKL